MDTANAERDNAINCHPQRNRNSCSNNEPVSRHARDGLSFLTRRISPVAARGDADSFVQLYRLHVRVIYRYLLARLGNRQDAEDVAAQVFQRAWTSLPRYLPRSEFKSWLFTIAHRALVDYYPRQLTNTKSMDSLSNALLDPAMGPEDGAVVKVAIE